MIHCNIIHIFHYFQLEKLIEKNYFLHKSAQEAYKSYIRAYASHSLKNIYEVNNLDLKKVALSFGFKVPPYVDLSILYNAVLITIDVSLCFCVQLLKCGNKLNRLKLVFFHHILKLFTV